VHRTYKLPGDFQALVLVSSLVSLFYSTE